MEEYPLFWQNLQKLTIKSSRFIKTSKSDSLDYQKK